MFEVQEALESQKQEFQKKEEVFRRREENLKKKDLELQESLIRFSKFLQENDSKRARAEKKASDEVKARLQKEREIEDLRVVYEDLKKQREAVHNLVERNMKYQHYLESVLEVTDDFQEVSDVITRFATLQATNADLKVHQEKCATLADSTRSELQTYLKQATDEILNKNNQIAIMKKELEGHGQEAAVLEMKKDYTLQHACQKTLEYGQVIMSTDNLFQRCREKSCIGHPPESNPLHQMTVIGNLVSDLGCIIKQYRQEQGKHHSKVEET